VHYRNDAGTGNTLNCANRYVRKMIVDSVHFWVNDMHVDDWDLLTTNQDVFRFFTQMIAFRKAHPSLGRSRFWREDVRWYGVAGAPDLSVDSHSFAWYLDGASQQDVDVYVMVNAFWQALTFVVQEGQPEHWRCVVDTGRASPDDVCELGSEPLLHDLRYAVGPRSVVVLVRPRLA
jgi:glycogen operon protein